MDNSILAYSTEGPAVGGRVNESIEVSCCDIYGNAGGDWVEAVESLGDTDGNFSLDPLFCDPEDEDFTLHSDSPCAPLSPQSPECGLIGAWPVGCYSTPVRETSWGAMKAIFLEEKRPK
jgi:hypothetical protein